MSDRRIDHADPVDGRRLRRERGRLAVIDATIDLVLEGHAPPSAEQVVERAGVSQASLFRYFATLDELRHEAIGRYVERFDHLIAIPDVGDGPVADRIRRLVASRDRLYRRTAPMARLARRQSADVDALADSLDRIRATFLDQIDQHFANELEPLGRAHRRRRVAVIAAVTSFETWEQLASLGASARRSALCEAVADLLRDEGRGDEVADDREPHGDGE